MNERLRRTSIVELLPGDFVVKPGYLCVYREDKEGWASLRADSGTRFEVVAVRSDELMGRRLSDGVVLTQAYETGQTVLKVVAA